MDSSLTGAVKFLQWNFVKSGHSFSGHPKLSWSGRFPAPKLDVWRVCFQEDSGLIHSSQGILLALVECVDPLAETKIRLRKGLEPLLYDLMVTSKTGEMDQLCPWDVCMECGTEDVKSFSRVLAQQSSAFHHQHFRSLLSPGHALKETNGVRGLLGPLPTRGGVVDTDFSECCNLRH